ncbi:unnamed protein product [Sphagnum balticum]
MHENGQITKRELNACFSRIRAEHNERVADILGVEDKDSLAEFSVGNQFGAALLEIGADEYFDGEEYDIEGLCHEIADLTDNEPEDVLAVLTGEIVPTDEFVLSLADQIGLDESTTDQLLLLGIDARGESIDDYLTGDEDETEYDTDEQEDESSYSAYSPANAEIARLKQEMAEFKASNAVNDRLSQIETELWELVDNQQIPPFIADFMMGQFNNDSERFAAFSQMCQRNGVDGVSQLHGMEIALSILKQLPVVNFGYMYEPELTEEEVREEQYFEDKASQIAKSMLANNTLIAPV